ncbi:hypothetical protein D3C81_2071610 [compost metagenome]
MKQGVNMMKAWKILFLVVILALTACDKKEQDKSVASALNSKAENSTAQAKNLLETIADLKGKKPDNRYKTILPIML